MLTPVVLALGIGGGSAPAAAPVELGPPARVAPLLQQEEMHPPPPSPPSSSPAWPLPDHWFEASFNDDSSINLAYRQSLGVGGGYLGGSLLVSEDEDWALDVRLMRYGRPGGSRFTLGAGLGVQYVAIDDPSEDAYALTFIGHGEYAFPTEFPIAASLEAAFSPDATTFDGSDGIVDIKGRVSVEVGAYGRAFVGYRYFEVSIDGGSDFEMADAFDVGIGLAW